MKEHYLPSDLCAAVFGHSLDGRAAADAVDTLEAQGLYELARDMKQGCDILGRCTVEHCVVVVPLTQLCGDVMLTDFGNSLASCVEPD